MKHGLMGLAAALAMSPALAYGQAPEGAPMTMSARYSEYRYQLDFHVNDAALTKLLPPGWVSNAATQGPAKDANIRLIFIDAANVVGPDDKLLGKGSDLLVYLAAPVKAAAGDGSGQMILAGIIQNQADAAFGVLDRASTVKVARSQTNASDTTMVTEDWDLAAANGEHATVHVKYTRAPANRTASSVNFYNPADPKSFQIFKTEQDTDITRNATTNPPDRVAEFSYKVSGGKFAALFDGSEKVLSWDSQPAYIRIVGTPAKP